MVRRCWLNIERRGVLLTWIIIVGQGPIALEVGRVGLLLYHFIGGGWSGGAIVLGKLTVPGRLTNLGKSKTRVYCAYSR